MPGADSVSAGFPPPKFQLFGFSPARDENRLGSTGLELLGSRGLSFGRAFTRTCVSCSGSRRPLDQSFRCPMPPSAERTQQRQLIKLGGLPLVPWPIHTSCLPGRMSSSGTGTVSSWAVRRSLGAHVPTSRARWPTSSLQPTLPQALSPAALLQRYRWPARLTQPGEMRWCTLSRSSCKAHGSPPPPRAAIPRPSSASRPRSRRSSPLSGTGRPAAGFRQPLPVGDGSAPVARFLEGPVRAYSPWIAA